jgi:hypothetical protein
MTREQLWKIYCDKNPSFAGEGNVTMSARGLRKLFEQTWDLAFYKGEDETADPTNAEIMQGMDNLRKIFGMS